MIRGTVLVFGVAPGVATTAISMLLGDFMRTALLLYVCSICCALFAPQSRGGCRAADPIPEGVSSRDARLSATRTIPYQRLTPQASELVRDVVENPSYFRRMPTQQIECNPDMFTFLVRRPEVMVNIWELMGITQVTTRRTSPLTFLANDGVGTTAKCDLIYGDEHLHIYYGVGNYDGTMAPRKLTGRCVCVLRSQSKKNVEGEDIVAGTMDVFLKLDNLGADLITRTLGSLVSKTADYNFVETARFMSQVSQICVYNPAAAQGLATQLSNVDGAVRQEFAAIAAKIAAEHYGEQAAVGVLLPSELELADSSSAETVPAEYRSLSAGREPEVASQLVLQDSRDDSSPASSAGRRIVSQPNTTPDSPMGVSSRPNPRDGRSETDGPNPIAPRKNHVFMRR
jgi:hypothetical protein